MSNEIAQINTLSAEVISNLVIKGDLSGLNSVQKVEYYNSLCERIGLDPATQPFKILKLNGKEVMYADKGAAQQLSKVYHISHEVISKEKVDDIYIVTCRATMKDGRFTDEAGAVTIAGLKGDNLANAIMKAITKSKRRAVLALLGLGMLDESEIETIKGVEPGPVIVIKRPEALPEPKIEDKAAPAVPIVPVNAETIEEAVIIVDPPVQNTDSEGFAAIPEQKGTDLSFTIGVVKEVLKKAGQRGDTYRINLDNGVSLFTREIEMAKKAKEMLGINACLEYEDTGKYKIAKSVSPIK